MAHHEGEQDEGADGTDFAPQRPQVPTPRHVLRWVDRDLRLALCTRRFGKRAAFNSLFSDRARRAHEVPSYLAKVHEDGLVINSRCGAPSLTRSAHSAFYSRQ